MFILINKYLYLQVFWLVDIMFILQNNNRGGYNVGDKTDKAAGGNAANQYQMVSRKF